jgi:hypothetical protein
MPRLVVPVFWRPMPKIFMVSRDSFDWARRFPSQGLCRGAIHDPGRQTHRLRTRKRERAKTRKNDINRIDRMVRIGKRERGW